MQLTTKNFRSAQKFLELFDYDRVTLQIRPDKGQWPREPDTKLLCLGDKASTAYSFTGSLLDQHDLLSDIQILQSQNMAVYFMVNEGDGEVHEGKNTCRSQKSVTHLTACFIDTDKGNPEIVESFAKTCPYHLKVESSPGRFHYYYLLEEKLPIDESISRKWNAIQYALMNLDRNFDHSLADTSQLLRLPYFYHLKKKPFLIKVVENQDVPRYSLNELFELTNAEQYLKGSHNLSVRGQRFEFPTAKIAPGSRHTNMLAYMRHLANKAPDLTQEDLEMAALGFARKWFEDAKDFMPGSERHAEIEHNASSIIEYVREEERQQEIQNIEEAGSDSSLEQSFYHSPDFFYECPNPMIGEMVKHSVKGALYPCPTFDFAAIVAMFGTLKSHLFVSSWGHAPCNYFLCFGPAGIGKTHSQHMVNSALYKLGEGKIFTGKLRSDKGMFRMLSENNSRCFVMMDEAEQFLAFLNNDKLKVEPYIKNIKTALLSLYSHHTRTFKSGMTGNEKDKEYEIENPHVNFIGFGTPGALQAGFSERSLADGMLPRFIILRAGSERVLNEDYIPDHKFTASQLDYVKHVIMDGKFKREDDLIAIEELQTEAEQLDTKNNKTHRDRMKEIEAELERLKGQNRFMGKPKRIMFTEKAEKRYLKFMKKMDARANLDPDNPISSIFGRVAEKAGRIATVIAEREIDTHLLDWCLEFVEKQLESELEACGNRGQAIVGAVDYDEMLYSRFIKFMDSAARGKKIARRDISRQLRISGQKLGRLIETGIEREEIVRADLVQKIGNGAKRKREAYIRKFEI